MAGIARLARAHGMDGEKTGAGFQICSDEAAVEPVPVEPVARGRERVRGGKVPLPERNRQLSAMRVARLRPRGAASGAVSGGGDDVGNDIPSALPAEPAPAVAAADAVAHESVQTLAWTAGLAVVALGLVTGWGGLKLAMPVLKSAGLAIALTGGAMLAGWAVRRNCSVADTDPMGGGEGSDTTTRRP